MLERRRHDQATDPSVPARQLASGDRSRRDNRAWLEGIAERDGGGIRSITLYQAQPAMERAEATVEVVRRHLVEDCRIPEDRVAVATGNQRELDGVDLFDPACKIEHVITVDALKEGWDCSFAYVFCSLASIRSRGAVEQLLGRVLRMPFATRHSSAELNRAYAHVSEKNFFDAAEGLHDRGDRRIHCPASDHELIVAEQIKTLSRASMSILACRKSGIPNPPCHDLEYQTMQGS